MHRWVIDVRTGWWRFINLLVDGLLLLRGQLVVDKAKGHGIKCDVDKPTYSWVDQLGIIQIKTTGVGSPQLAEFRGGQVRRFAYAAGDDGDGEFHIPHDWAPGTDIFLHMHWGHNGTAISGSLVVDFYLTYGRGHNQEAFGAEINPQLTVSTPDIATVPRWRHRIDEFQLSAKSPSATQFDTDNLEPDGLILFHWDVTTIPTITGGSPNKPFLLYMLSRRNACGSRGRSRNTTRKSQR